VNVNDLRAWWHERATSETDLSVWLGLLVALIGLLATGTPPRTTVLALIVVAITLALSLRWRIASVAVIVLLVVGVVLRMQPPTGFSDVLLVTEAAIRETLAGGSPYGHGFAASLPPGAPFAYGPVVLLWYLPSLDDPGRMEEIASLGILLLLAIRGRALGLAIYAVTPALIVAMGDGANDTSAGLLLLISLLVAVRAPVAGAAMLAITTAFKPYALAWLPGLLAFGGVVGPLIAFGAISLLTWGLASLAWGPDAILRSFQRANDLHGQAYYSLAYAVGAPDWVPKPAWQALRVGVGVLVAVLSFVVVRSATSFVVVGALVFGATLFLGWWSTFAYVAAVAPIICWHIDDWLGLGAGRAVWPNDPVRAVTEWADTRWPVRESKRIETVSSPADR
jgi:hypothetical protein